MKRTITFRTMVMVFAMSAALVFMGSAVVLSQDSGDSGASGVGEGEKNLEVGPGGSQKGTPKGQDTGFKAGRRDPGQPGAPQAADDPQSRVDLATNTLQEMMNRQGDKIPPEVIQNAQGIAIFPDVTKAGLIAGGRYGTGVLMIKQENEWNGPLFLSIYGASIGAQIGVEQTDLIMVFNDPKSLQALQDGTLEFGAEASVAAGSYGEKAAASTEAEIIAYSDTEGAFAGISLSSGYIEVNPEANNQYFQQEGDETRAYYPSAEEMISGKKAPETEQARQLTQTLDQYGQQSGQQGQQQMQDQQQTQEPRQAQ